MATVPSAHAATGSHCRRDAARAVAREAAAAPGRLRTVCRAFFTKVLYFSSACRARDRRK